MVKENCCLYREILDRNGEIVRICDGLTALYCANKECRFFKTKEQYEKQRAKAEQRPEYQDWLAVHKKKKIFNGEIAP